VAADEAVGGEPPHGRLRPNERPTPRNSSQASVQEATHGRRPALRASFDAYSASQADRWVMVALRAISPTLPRGIRGDVGPGPTVRRPHPGPVERSYAKSRAQSRSLTPAPASPGQSAPHSCCHSPTDRASNSHLAHTTSRPATTLPCNRRSSLGCAYDGDGEDQTSAKAAE
jgi:hypothetical protein